MHLIPTKNCSYIDFSLKTRNCRHACVLFCVNEIAKGIQYVVHAIDFSIFSIYHYNLFQLPVGLNVHLLFTSIYIVSCVTLLTPAATHAHRQAHSAMNWSKEKNERKVKANVNPIVQGFPIRTSYSMAKSCQLLCTSLIV